VSSTATSAAGANPALATSVSQYLDLDWSRLRDNYTQLREFLPAAPFLQALPLAGAIAALWRSPPKALLLAGWVGAFLVVKGSSDQASIESGTLLRLFMPGFPPLLMLSALVPLLVLSPRRLRAEAPPESASVGARAVGAALVVFGLLPLLLFLVFSPLHDRTAVKYFAQNVMVPVDRSFTVTVGRGGGGELVEWKPQQSPGVRRFYRVFRVRPRRSAPDPTLPAGRDGIRCLDASASPHDRAADCRLEMKYVGSTRMSRFVDKPPAGPWTYRVGLAANWRDDVTIGDVLLLSAPGRLSALH
jgi:hypothetical protein